ncbi:S1/P1 nuclease [uncultured Alistipes sp.]|jgi:S1/P1 nuclease|uniref:S1/P1 nuclease n=1 Tax=uncultured Alistipes sp. TaxID=538949 RepID=UPI0025E0647F|nr:S1/P1 nuclease [uncultured Alistipes sp.]
MKRILLIAVLAALVPTRSAVAWGRLGHATVAYIAEQHLTKKAKANLDKWLDGRSIVYYASYMDDYKPQMLVDLGYAPSDGPRMHMLPHTFSVDQTGEVIRGNRLPGDKYLANCLYYIEQSAERLKNELREMDDSTRLACIQIIVHSVGDMHCPCHIRYPDNQDIGYFNVVLNGSEIRYHTIWDTPIVQTSHPWSFTDLAYLLDRYSKKRQEEVTAGDIYAWGRESAAVSKCVYDVKEGDKLKRDFLNKYKPLAEAQLTKAGYRLAKVLNDIFDR